MSAPDAEAAAREDAAMERYLAAHFRAAATSAEPQSFFGISPTDTRDTPAAAPAGPQREATQNAASDDDARIDAYVRHFWRSGSS